MMNGDVRQLWANVSTSLRLWEVCSGHPSQGFAWGSRCLRPTTFSFNDVTTRSTFLLHGVACSLIVRRGTCDIVVSRTWCATGGGRLCDKVVHHIWMWGSLRARVASRIARKGRSGMNRFRASDRELVELFAALERSLWKLRRKLWRDKLCGRDPDKSHRVTSLRNSDRACCSHIRDLLCSVYMSDGNGTIQKYFLTEPR